MLETSKHVNGLLVQFEEGELMVFIHKIKSFVADKKNKYFCF
jgi:hypothetical protein